MSQITYTQTIDFGQRTPRIDSLHQQVDLCSTKLSQSLKFAAGFTTCAALTALRFNATPVRITFGVVSIIGLITSSMFSYQASKDQNSCEVELNRLSQLRKTIKDLHEMTPSILATSKAKKNFFRGILRQLLKAVKEDACTEQEALAFIRSHIEKATLDEPQHYLNYLEGLAKLNEGFKERFFISESAEIAVLETLQQKWRAVLETEAASSDPKNQKWVRALYSKGTDYANLLKFDIRELEKLCKEYCSRLFKYHMDQRRPLYRLGNEHELCIYGAKILPYTPEEGVIRTWVKSQFFEYIDAQIQSSSSRHFANIPRVIEDLLQGCTLSETEIREISEKVQLNAIKKIFSQFLSGQRSYANIRMILNDFKGALESHEKHVTRVEFSLLKEKLMAGLAIEKFQRELGISSETVDISTDHEFLGVCDLDSVKTELQMIALQHQLAHVNFLISSIDCREVQYQTPSRLIKDPMGADKTYQRCTVEFDGFLSLQKIVPDFSSMPVSVTPEQFKCSERYLPDEISAQLAATRLKIQQLDQANSAASRAVYDQLSEELESVTISQELQQAIDGYNTELDFSMSWPNQSKDHQSQRKEIASQIMALKSRNTILRSEIPGLALELAEEKKALKTTIEAELKGNERLIEELRAKDTPLLVLIEAGERRLKSKTLQAAYGVLKELIDGHNKPLLEKYARAKDADNKIAADTVEKTRTLIATYGNTLKSYSKQTLS